MIIISQDGYEQINFDNVKRLILDDSYISGTNIFVEFTDGTTSTMPTFKEATEAQAQGLEDLRSVLDYRGNLREAPQDKKEPPCWMQERQCKKISIYYSTKVVI